MTKDELTGIANALATIELVCNELGAICCNCGPYSPAEIHLRKEEYVNIFGETPRTEHDLTFDEMHTDVAGVRVFCLTPKEQS